MFEVADACHYHGNAVFVAVFNTVVVANRAARLDYSIDACIMGNFHAICKREECVGGENSTVSIA